MSEELKRQDRQELVVWLYSVKKTRPLQKYGYVYYISKKRKYAIMYINQENSDKVISKIEKLNFVREVEKSPRQELNMDFSEALDPERERISHLKKADNLFEQEN